MHHTMMAQHAPAVFAPCSFSSCTTSTAGWFIIMAYSTVGGHLAAAACQLASELAQLFHGSALSIRSQKRLRGTVGLLAKA